MVYNQLGSSGSLVVSEVCLGTMVYGEQVSEADAHEQLSYAHHERGVTFFDTAELYPITPRRSTQGRTSEILGTWLAGQKRDAVVLATKVAGRSGNSPWIPANRTVPRGAEAPTEVDSASIRAALEAELRRLKTDYIDLYQIHWPSRYSCTFGRNQYQAHEEVDYVPFEEQVETMGQLVQEGKVREWGLSNETSFGVMRFCVTADALGVQRPCTVQNCFNLLHRTAETELAECCSPRHLNIGILPWSPLCGGALTGKYLHKDGLENARFTLFPDRYPRYNSKRVHDAVRKYVAIAYEAGCTPAQLALAWCKSRWFVPSTVIGAATMDQLEENLDAFELDLPEAVLSVIDDVHALHRNPALGN